MSGSCQRNDEEQIMKRFMNITNEISERIDAAFMRCQTLESTLRDLKGEDPFTPMVPQESASSNSHQQFPTTTSWVSLSEETTTIPNYISGSYCCPCVWQ